MLLFCDNCFIFTLHLSRPLRQKYTQRIFHIPPSSNIYRHIRSANLHANIWQIFRISLTEPKIAEQETAKYIPLYVDAV